MSNQPDHASRGHAEFSPSSLKYLAKCPSYQGINGTSAASEMGTRIHEALEVSDPSALHNEQELEIYEKIVAAEQEFLEMVFGDKLRTEFNEIQVDVPLRGTETWGTCDRLTISGNKGVMGDYKTGISIIDPPERNWQAKAYIIGAFHKFPELDEIIFVFYVPQLNQTLSHLFFRSDLDGLVDEVSKVILAAEKARPKWVGGTPSFEELTPSVNCRFCLYERVCPALGALVVEVAKKIDPQLPDIDIQTTTDPQALEDLWNIAKIVTEWADRHKARTIELAKGGLELPTLRLRSMGAPKKVTDVGAFVSVAEDFGMDQKELLEQCSVPLSKIAKAIGDKAEKSEKKKISQDFVDACQNAGIIESSDPRMTLS